MMAYFLRREDMMIRVLSRVLVAAATVMLVAGGLPAIITGNLMLGPNFL
jgi:hypothetical protein